MRYLTLRPARLWRILLGWLDLEVDLSGVGLDDADLAGQLGLGQE